MLRSLDSLMEYGVNAYDGPVGAVHDFYFMTRSWQIRYLLVDTGRFLTGRRVLISPDAFGEPDWASSTFPIRHTQEEIENSPDADTALPLSRHLERRLHSHFRWMPYWAPEIPAYPYESAEAATAQEVPQKNGDLCGFRDLLGFTVEAVDGPAGTISDVIVDDRHWEIRMLVIDTGNWLSGKQVLLGRDVVAELKVPEREVRVAVDVAAVREAPEFDPNEPVNQEHEVRLYDYYGRPQNRLE
jgi:uncharacterized protein YrrD